MTVDPVLGTLPRALDTNSNGPDRDYVADGIDAVQKAATDKAAAASTFLHDGETYTLRPVVDLRVPVALQRGAFLRALELALVGGLDDVDRILDSNEPLDPDRLEGILEGWAQTLGTSLGESEASSG